MTKQEQELRVKVFELVQGVSEHERLRLVELILPKSERCADNDGQIILYTGIKEKA